MLGANAMDLSGGNPELAVFWINGRRGETLLWIFCWWVVIWVEKKRNGFVLVGF